MELFVQTMQPLVVIKKSKLNFVYFLWSPAIADNISNRAFSTKSTFLLFLSVYRYSLTRIFLCDCHNV